MRALPARPADHPGPRTWRRGPRVGWGWRGIAAGCALLALGTALALAGAVGGSRAGELTRAEVLNYQGRLWPIAQNWGSIEVDGMRPAVYNLATGHGVPARMITIEARAWRYSLGVDARKLAALHPPAALRRAQALFAAAMADYLRAATLFGRATLLARPARHPLLLAGIAAAERGDTTYDDASADLQRARARVGLAVTTDFPDPRSSG